jgi:hypothetical protein
MAKAARVGTVVLHGATGRVVVLASEIAAIDTGALHLATEEVVVDFRTSLPWVEGSGDLHGLVVDSAAGRLVFRTDLGIELTDIGHACFFALPRLFARVRGWVKGVVVMKTDAGVEGPPPLALWVSLRELGEDVLMARRAQADERSGRPM